MAKTASMPEAPRLLKSTPTSRRNTGARSGESPSRLGWKKEAAKSGCLAREGRMTLKPSLICDVAADTPSMKKAIGPKLAKQFSANPKVAKYAFVLKFPDGVVTGRAVSHAL